MSKPITQDAGGTAVSVARSAGAEDGRAAGELYMRDVPDEDCPRILAGLRHDDPQVAEEVFGGLPEPQPNGYAFTGPVLYETACRAAGLDPYDVDLKTVLFQQVYDSYEDAFAGAAEAEIIYLAELAGYKAGPWYLDDDAGVQPGGDTGRDIQAGQSYSVRYRRLDRPGAMITRWAYPAEYRAWPGEIIVQVLTEWRVCEDPGDPDGTEVWSDCSTDDELPVYDNVSDAEQAALNAATEMLSQAEELDWDGLAPWEHEGGQS